jgi:hypothetical protein
MTLFNSLEKNVWHENIAINKGDLAPVFVSNSGTVFSILHEHNRFFARKFLCTNTDPNAGFVGNIWVCGKPLKTLHGAMKNAEREASK